MSKAQKKSKTFYIEYIFSLFKTLTPSLLQTSSEFIILSTTLSSNMINELMHMLPIKEKYPCHVLQPGIPSTIYFAEGNRVIANFGEYVFRDEQQTQTSKQSMLNILYSFEKAKNIKILMIFDDSSVMKHPKNVINMLNNFSNTFREEMMKTSEEEEDKKVLDMISQGVGIVILQKNEKTKMEIFYQKFKKISESQQLTDSKFLRQTMKRIIDDKSLLILKKSTQNIWTEICAIPTFGFSPSRLKAYFAYNLKQPTNQIEKQRKQAIYQSIKIFQQKLWKIITQIKENISDILSLDQSLRKSFNMEITGIIRSLGFSENLINKYDKQNNLIVIICEIFKELAELCMDQEKSMKNEVCLPWEIIRIIYKWEIISESSQNECLIYNFGLMIKMSFQTFSYIPQFQNINQIFFNELRQLFTKVLNHLSLSLPTFTENLKNQGVRPKKIDKVIKKLEETIALLQSFIKSAKPWLNDLIDEIENILKYIEIEVFKIKHLYLEKMINNLTINEKLTLFSSIYKGYLKNENELNSVYNDSSKKLLGLIYENLGDQFSRNQRYYFAIKFYQNGGAFHKLGNVCISYLEQKLTEIKLEDFEEIVGILVKLGFIEISRRYCYQFLENSSNEEKVRIYQILLQTADEQIKYDDKECMKFITTSYITNIKLMESSRFDQNIKCLKEAISESLRSLPVLPSEF